MGRCGSGIQTVKFVPSLYTHSLSQDELDPTLAIGRRYRQTGERYCCVGRNAQHASLTDAAISPLVRHDDAEQIPHAGVVITLHVGNDDLRASGILRFQPSL